MGDLEWISILKKRISTHVTVLFMCAVFVIVFSVIAIYFLTSLVAIVRDYMKQSARQRETMSGLVGTMGSGVTRQGDNETYVNPVNPDSADDSVADAFAANLNEMRSKFQSYNSAAAQIAASKNKGVTDVLDDRVFDHNSDDYKYGEDKPGA